ncbi:MAG: chondroitinase-B domain-containing protein [Candidatus Hodarchaeales archaeon]|jgi:poly(beta-D-mannuronate) lyase
MELLELNKKLNEGHTYNIKSGEYPKSKITIKSSGTADNPIHIVADNVILSNETTLNIKGSYVIFEGFVFQNVNINKMVKLEGDYIQLRNCVFEGMKKDVECILRVTGQNCKILNNKFSYFDKKGCLIIVQHTEDKPSFCSIMGNSFLDRREGKGNGYEIIRLGDSNSSLWDGKNIIYNNSFNMCNGEIEIVSIKCCKNVIYANKFLNSKGGLCLRHGRDNVVAYNYFDGSYTPGSAGVRITGKGHKIFYNTFQYLEDDEPFRSALTIMCGELNNKLNGYEPVENVEIKFNDFIHCRDVMSLGVNNKRKSNIKPKNLIITENRIIKCVGMFNMSKKVLGYESSKVTDNKILKYEQKLIMKKPENSYYDMDIIDVYEKLYNLQDEVIITKEDKEIEIENNKNKEEKEDISKKVVTKLDKVISGSYCEAEEKKEGDEGDLSSQKLRPANKELLEIIEDMKKEFEEEMKTTKKRLEALKNLAELLN